MPVDIFIDMAQNVAEKGYNHYFLRSVFSVNREVRLSDLLENQFSISYQQQEEYLSQVALPNSLKNNNDDS